jgi:hypothetical protein
MIAENAPSRRSITIQSLPPEILVHIVGFLSEFDRKYVALTNKIFHEAVCEVEKFKMPLEITKNTVNIKL